MIEKFSACFAHRVPQFAVLPFLGIKKLSVTLFVMHNILFKFKVTSPLINNRFQVHSENLMQWRPDFKNIFPEMFFNNFHDPLEKLFLQQQWCLFTAELYYTYSTCALPTIFFASSSHLWFRRIKTFTGNTLLFSSIIMGSSGYFSGN